MDLLESLETDFQDLLGCIQNSLYIQVSWALLLRHNPSKSCAACLECSMRHLHHGLWELQHALPFCWAPGISASIDRPVLLFCLSVLSLSHAWLSETPWTAACQASLSFPISWSLLKRRSIQSIISSNHLILYHSLLLLPSIFPSIRVFSSESALHISWPKYCSFPSAFVLPMNIQDWFLLGWTGWITLLSKMTLKSLLHTNLNVQSKSPCALCTDLWRYFFA